MMRDVYFYNETNQISFIYEKGKSLCIGETDETLQDFLDWMKKDWEERNCDMLRLPTIKEETK